MIVLNTPRGLKYFFVAATFLLLVAGAIWSWVGPSLIDRAYADAGATRATRVRERVAPHLRRQLQSQGLTWGSEVFIRIFKQEKMLELWLKKGDRFVLFRQYPICTYSGTLGPKLREGDGQAPEGFYSVRPSQMNPASQFHLSFNLGYPNAFDRAHGPTGNYLMVHGNCVSIGCYAMGDAAIEEIYTLMDAAFSKGQSSIDVHAHPFTPNAHNWSAHHSSPWMEFWQELSVAHDAFERERVPPRVRVQHKRYVIESIP